MREGTSSRIAEKRGCDVTYRCTDTVTTNNNEEKLGEYDQGGVSGNQEPFLLHMVLQFIYEYMNLIHIQHFVLVMTN